MSWQEITLVVILVIFLLLLLRASSILGQNPYLRLKMHEDLGVKFPDKMPFLEKQKLLDRWGIFPRDVKRPLGYVAIALAAFFLVRWLGR